MPVSATGAPHFLALLTTTLLAPKAKHQARRKPQILNLRRAPKRRQPIIRLYAKRQVWSDVVIDRNTQAGAKCSAIAPHSHLGARLSRTIGVKISPRTTNQRLS